MDKTILVDCDDVLISWIDGFRRFCVIEKGVVLHTHEPDAWNMAEWLGQPSEVVHRWIEEFNGNSWEFGALPPLLDAQNALAILSSYGYRFTCVSSCSSRRDVYNLRRANLHNHFGDVFSSVICLDVGVSKKTVLETFAPTIWVEDNYKNALEGHEVGHKAFVLRRRHNRMLERDSHPEITWVDSWHDIIEWFDNKKRLCQL